MAVSMTKAFERAKDLTYRDLFVAPTANRWLVLALMTFLSSLGDTTSLRIPTSWLGDLPNQANAWIAESYRTNFTMLMGLVSIAGLVSLAVYLLFLRLASRTDVMFADAVMTGTATFAEPWKRLKTAGDRIWIARVAVQATMFVWVSGLLAYLLTRYDWDFLAMLSREALSTTLPFAGLALVLVGPALIALHILGAMILPIVMAYDVDALRAVMIFRDRVIAHHAADLVVFYFAYWMAGIVATMLTVIVTAFTCCIAAIPFVMQVVFLPIAYYFRALSIAFLEQTNVLKARE